MSELSHQKIADAASVWLSKPFSSLVVQELASVSYAGSLVPQFRMDVVAVIPNQQRIVVVECKASRSDFLRGAEKLEAYQGFCHQLYVAAPKDMIDPDELPKGVGLLTIGARGGARSKRWPQYNQLPPGRYVQVLERVLQKLVITRWQSPWMGRRPGAEQQHWPGDGCEGSTSAIRSHLTHQNDLYRLAFQGWIAAVEGV